MAGTPISSNGGFQKALDWWKEVSAPVEKALQENADTVIAGAALISLGPLALVLLLTILRAALDLRMLSKLQVAALGSLVSVALATLVMTEGPARDFVMDAPRQAAAAWATMRDPIQKILEGHADAFVAGAAALTFGPLALLAVMVALRFLFGWGKQSEVEPHEPSSPDPATTTRSVYLAADAPMQKQITPQPISTYPAPQTLPQTVHRAGATTAGYRCPTCGKGGFETMQSAVDCCAMAGAPAKAVTTVAPPQTVHMAGATTAGYGMAGAVTTVASPENAAAYQNGGSPAPTPPYVSSPPQLGRQQSQEGYVCPQCGKGGHPTLQAAGGCCPFLG